MTAAKRIECLERICNDLQLTSSRLEKEDIVNNISDELKDDFQYILEILAGQHKLGYSYICMSLEGNRHEQEMTLRQYLSPLYLPMEQNDLSMLNTLYAMKQCQYYNGFIQSIVNRTLRLGIGKSQLPKDGLAPMLAKKFEDVRLTGEYYITEKLDGNRCIARYDGTKWVFTSRNGKPLKVNIDMGDLPTDVVYDGELLSLQQTIDSNNLFAALSRGKPIPAYQKLFNKTSGMINSKANNKDLVYNIFDIMIDLKYKDRRRYLDSLIPRTEEVRILPVLTYVPYNRVDVVNALLQDVTSAGAEGLILNATDAMYQHKRTSDLIKVKNTYTMDMLVIDWEYGEGKYEYMLGALVCMAMSGDKKVYAKVGSGLTDVQRLEWANDPSLIVGKLIEVGYFDMSQNATTTGTKEYSLRFPRLKQIRYDKDITSID